MRKRTANVGRTESVSEAKDKRPPPRHVVPVVLSGRILWSVEGTQHLEASTSKGVRTRPSITKHTRMPMSDSAKDSNSDEPELTLERQTRTARILSDGYMRDNEAAARDWMAG